MTLPMKQRIYRLLRSMYILMMLDRLLFCLNIIKNVSDNKRIVRENPMVHFPPYDLAYDAYGSCSYRDYINSGMSHAELFLGLIKDNIEAKNPVVCEWGCGPARVLQPMHAIEKSFQLIGTDYNQKTIEWCKRNIPEIHFITNELRPPINIPSDTLDVFFCLSVFTHLSEAMHTVWRDEIVRVLKPGGLFIGTFHGTKTQHVLLPDEQKKFQRDEIVVRGNIKEGKKHFLAYHSDGFVRKFLQDFTTVTKIETSVMQQSVWYAKKITH